MLNGALAQFNRRGDEEVVIRIIETVRADRPRDRERKTAATIRSSQKKTGSFISQEIWLENSNQIMLLLNSKTACKS